MAERDLRERDILVAPGEYAYVQDLTKGDIVLYVGPTKISLSNTERMIMLRDDRFVPVGSDEIGQGVQSFVGATSAQYIVLENPPVPGTSEPVKGANSAVPLDMGRKIVVPGPARFPLWPGQTAQVVDGHELRQDEYLLVRVYDQSDDMEAPIGSELIVRGSEVSFYVPITGLEVVPVGATYVRKALRLDKSQGLHLRVISPLDADGSSLIPAGSYEAGQEIFIRDTEGYYVPQSAVEAIGLVSRVSLAENEAIYVRDHDSGALAAVYGPTNYLPDPTRETMVTRHLGERLSNLYRVRHSADDRAVSIDIPPSTAIMVIGAEDRDVVIGPCTRILGYHEYLEELSLSMGRPKCDDELLPTCFLQTEGNKVSDQVTVNTRDHVELELLLSYRVSFVGDSQRWFAVKNYVGLLCDHLGSIVRAAARGTDINRFHTESTELIRAAILGPRGDDGKREGRLFEENGMWVYDVEVLDVSIMDNDVEELLAQAQHAAIVSDISRKREELRLGDEKTREYVNREICSAQLESFAAATELETARRAQVLATITTEGDAEKARRAFQAAAEAEAHTIESSAVLATREREVAIEAARLDAQAESFGRQMAALQPELIATLKSLGSQRLAGELSKNLAPLAILGGESVADVAERLLDRLPISGANGQGARGLFKSTEAADDDGQVD